MKATCIECGEHNEWVSECPECNEMICDECWPMHERHCKTFHFPDVDIFGMCYSDADPGL